MPVDPPSLLEKVDVFHLLDSTASGPSPASAADEGLDHVSEEQYRALVHMVAANLNLPAHVADSLFPSYRVEQNAAHLSSPSSPPPPLCAHLSREGVEQYWAAASGVNNIPDVRCCDARDVERREPFPATGHGPHVHCLHCFHSAIDASAPAGRGVPPPVVADFRDALTLQAHQQTHHDRYLTYLALLDDSCGGGAGADMLSDEGRAACESAAEEEGRHGCYMASMGTAACPITTYYCADCDTFAPLARFLPDGGAPASTSWTSTEALNVMLSRLLLSCHVLYMLDGTRFTRRSGDVAASDDHHTRAPRNRHVIFLFRPILFHDGVAEDVVEEFEDGSECTHAAAVLPNASVTGSPGELLLLLNAEACAITDEAAESTTYAPVVIGFAMEWATEDAVQAKLQLLEAQHEVNADAAGAAVAPFHVCRRWIYIEDTEEWVMAHVPYHHTITKRADLPTTYADGEEEGIRVAASYQIDAPVPQSAAAAERGARSTDSEAAAMEQGDDEGGEQHEAAEDPLALDGCPYSMESRTVDFFARMTVLAKAMQELAAWRSTIDENKETFP